MTNGKLVLQAPHDRIPVNQQALVTHLAGFGLIGSSYGETPGVYLVGPKFLQLITFLGCSPHLQLEPRHESNEEFSHIRLLGPFEKPRLLCAGNTRPPRCPGCGKGLTQWRELAAAWMEGMYDLEITCRDCGQRSSPLLLNWRRKAGFGRYFIEIFGIFPEEALPLPELMECLRRDGPEWSYFYLNDW